MSALPGRLKPPRKAVVLAAGHGERMRPLSLDVPKPLLPFHGIPVLGRTLAMLETWGVEEILMNLHHCPGKIVEYALKSYSGGATIDFSYEPVILGTGGAVRKAEWFIGNDPFWIVNADVIANLDFGLLLKTYSRVRPLAVLWLDGSRGPRTVEMKRGRIIAFGSRHSGAQGTYTFCGVQLVSPEILDHISGPGFSSIIDAYSSAIARGRKVLGVCDVKAFWADIGTPAGYLKAHVDAEQYFRGEPFFARRASQVKRTRRLFARRKIRLEGFVSLGPGVRIGRGAHIRDSIILEGAAIRAGARVENGIVGPNATVAGTGKGMIVRADAAGDSRLCGIVEGLGWPIEKTSVQILPPRGSDRTFVRIRHGAESAVVVRYGRERTENERYVQNARFLGKAGLSVPGIIMDRPNERLTVLQDVGDISLLDAIAARSKEELYRQALDAVAVLHVRGTRLARKGGLRLERAFSEKLYQWEHDLFAEQFLVGRLAMKRAAVAGILEDLDRVSRRLLKERRVLIHRDLQSSNIHLHKGRMVFLDFQGMRFGPASYDLASLLCDPYAMLSEQLQERLLEYYAFRVKIGIDEVTDAFWWAAVQRLVQAVGAYARLGASRATARFAGHIRPAFQMLRRTLGHVDKLWRLWHLVCYTLEKEEEE